MLLAAGLARDRGVVGTLQVVGAGALVMFVGLATLAPVLARPFTRLLAPLLDRTLGVTGTLARGNAGRNPRRTAATASATVVGLGLVSLVAIFAASAKASVRDAIGSGLRADLVVRAEQLADFSAGVGQRIRSLPEVEAVAGLRLGDAEVDGRTVAVFGTDPATVEEVVDLGIVEGDVAGLAGGGSSSRSPRRGGSGSVPATRSRSGSCGAGGSRSPSPGCTPTPSSPVASRSGSCSRPPTSTPWSAARARSSSSS
ncbi:MAG: hypothetical protein M5U14_04405 [Acidimicrobiia bacterium]|nr:hypothetical protein [Acidimicrobiia bacterium]